MPQNRNRPASLKDNIHVILHGTKEQKERLKGQNFHLADTPEFLKGYGLTGEFFTVRYGVISRHFGKDEAHCLSEDNWNELCNAITKPFAIARYDEGYRLFTSVKSKGKYVAVGVNVKNTDKGLDVNSVATAFGYDRREQGSEDIIYQAKKLTPEQAALLDGLNSLSLPPEQGST